MDDLIKKLKKMVNEENNNNNENDNNSNDDIDEYENNNKYENEEEDEKIDVNNNINSLNPNLNNNINNNRNNTNIPINNNNHCTLIVSNDSNLNINNNNNNMNNINNMNSYTKQKNFYETQIDKPFTVSEMKLSRSRSSSKNRKNRFSKSLSEENNKLNKPSNNLSLISKTMYLDKENQDSITNLLTKTLAHIKSNKNNYDIDLITNNLNQILDLYINSLSNQRLKNVKSSEKDIILQTKYETAEKMVKSFELKYLTSEKEKKKIIEQYEKLERNYNIIKEKNEVNVQKNEEFLRLEKNNYVLIQTNEDLKKQINEINIQNDFVKKKYEDEIKVVQKLLNQYHQQLLQLQNKIFMNNKSGIKKDNDTNIMNDGRINNVDNNLCLSPNNDKSLTLNSL